MLLPFGIFWVMLFLTRQDLGLKGIIITAVLGAGFLAAFLLVPVLWVYAVIAQVIMDIVLILVLFGGDIRVN